MEATGNMQADMLDAQSDGLIDEDQGNSIAVLPRGKVNGVSEQV